MARIASVVNSGSSRRCERRASTTASSLVGDCRASARVGFRVANAAAAARAVIASKVEEYGLFRSLQDDVPFQRSLVTRRAASDQGRAPLRGHQVEHGVLRVGGIVGKINARDKVLEQAAH